MTDFTEIKAKQKTMWGLGDYDAVTPTLQPAQDHVIRVARPQAGEKVLDVATGTGNTAIKARAFGASVTGIDFAPEMLMVARKKAEGEGYADIKFEEGDAGKLPYADASFDVVLSTCGHMFAPDQEAVGREMMRVTRPGGRIVFMAWTPDGGVGKLFQVISRHVPSPAGVPPPFNWGVAQNVQKLLPGAKDVRHETGDSPDFLPDAESAARLWETKYGPTVRAMAALPDDAKRAALHRDLVEMFQGYTTPIDGKVRWGREYLLTSARKA